MAIREMIESAAAQKGTIHRVEYVRDAYTRAKNPPPARLRKRTVFSMRLGHSYYNQEAVKEKHETGERAVVGLPDNMRHLSPAIVENTKNNQIYMVGQPIGRPEVVWELGGATVPKSEIAPYLLASEFSDKEGMPDHLTLKIDGIVSFK